MNPKVLLAEAVDDHCLLLTFSNGERRQFNIQPYLGIGVFKALTDAQVFKAVRVVSGSVEWPGDIDLSYNTLYLESSTA